MKTLLVLAIVLCATLVAATPITVSTHVSASVLTVTAADDITITVGGQLDINVNLTARSVTVAGGMWNSTGGKKTTADGFYMTSGTWNLGAADTIIVRNLNVLGTDEVSITGGSAVWSGTTANPVVIRTNPTSGSGSVKVSGAGAVLTWSKVKFVNMTDPVGNLFTGGVTFQSRTTPANTSITGMVADSCDVTIYNCTGFKWNGGSIFATNGNIGLEQWTTNSDSIIGVSISTYASHGIYSHCDNPFYKKDTIIDRITFDNGGYVGNFDFDAVTNPIVDSCILGGKVQAAVLCAGGTSSNIKVQFSRLTGGTHEQIHSDANVNGLILQGNYIYGGGARGLVTPQYGKILTGLKLYYNTIVSQGGGAGKGSLNLGCINATGCNVSTTGAEEVGNIFLCSNTTYGDISIDGGTTVNNSKFSYNVFHEIDTSAVNSHFAVPAGEWATNKITDQAKFQDSANANWTLLSGSALLNAAESTIFVQVFGASHAADAPGDIGAYQSFTTGGGGAPGTGACCLPNGTCATTTAVNCQGQGGTYQGDNTNCSTPGICPPGPGPGPGAGPAPLCKQLRIASLCYYAPWWSGNNLGGYQASMRDWAANHYAMLITVGGTPSEIAYMKSINPNLKTLLYSKFGRPASDTATLRAMCDTLGLTFRSVILHTATANVTTTMPVGGDCYGCTASITTTADSSPILFHFWQAAQTRVSLDPRNWQSGALLWRILKYEMRNGTATTADDWDGIMLDEETRWTGTFPGEGPIMPVTGDTWPTSILNPFTGITAFADSQASWRGYWAKTLGDSAVANGKLVLPNGTSYWGVSSGQALAGWTGEGRHATKLYHGAFLNEDHRSYYYNSVDQLKNWPKLAYDLRDSAVNMVLAYIPVGMVDSSCGNLSFPRQKMNFLGHALNCTFSGTTNVYFSPKWSTFGQYGGSNDVHQNYGAVPQVCRTVSWNDTTSEWSPTWGKYFGLPVNTKDTAQSGTDGAGQTYKVFKSAFTHPTNGPGDTLTISLMRYDNGTINTAATAINVTLPGAPSKVWYELLDNTFDSAGIGPSKQAFWRPAGFVGGSTITLMNSQARVFSHDTVLANAGINDTTITLTGDAKIEGQDLVFTISLNQVLSNQLRVDVYTTDGTAISGNDYVSVLGYGYVAPGSLTGTVTVTTIDDPNIEPDETLTLTIANPTYGHISPGPTATATGTIINNDNTPPQTGTGNHYRHWRKF